MKPEKVNEIINTCNAQSVTVTYKTVTSRALRSPRWYGMSPATVLLDKSISAEAARAFGIIAMGAMGSNTSTIGLRLLGRLMGKTHGSAQRYVKELISAGHVERKAVKNGGRMVYVLTSPVFEPQAAKVICKTCGAERDRIDEAGMCIICRKQAGADQEVSEFLNAEPWTTQQDVWAKFKSRSHGTKYSNSQLESAYVKWRLNQRKMESA
jgi:DNA-binding MarR family transcriptional regulator